MNEERANARETRRLQFFGERRLYVLYKLRTSVGRFGVPLPFLRDARRGNGLCVNG